MRLDQKEIQLIIETILKEDKLAQVYLYGSKIDENARGGDIDLLIISNILKLDHKLKILVQLKYQLGDQKIDLSILSPDEYKRDPFFKAIHKVLLKT